MIAELLVLAWLIKHFTDRQLRYLTKDEYKRLEDKSCQ